MSSPATENNIFLSPRPIWHGSWFYMRPWVPGPGPGSWFYTQLQTCCVVPRYVTYDLSVTNHHQTFFFLTCLPIYYIFFFSINNMARDLPETWTGFYLKPLVKMLNVLLSIYSKNKFHRYLQLRKERKELNIKLD